MWASLASFSIEFLLLVIVYNRSTIYICDMDSSSPHIPLLMQEEGMNLVKLKEYDSKDQEEERGEGVVVTRRSEQVYFPVDLG